MNKLILLLPVVAPVALLLSACETTEQVPATTTTTTHTETIQQQAPTQTSTSVTRQSMGGGY